MRVHTGRFTNGEYPLHSSVAVRFHPQRTHTDQALFLRYAPNEIWMLAIYAKANRNNVRSRTALPITILVVVAKSKRMNDIEPASRAN